MYLSGTSFFGPLYPDAIFSGSLWTTSRRLQVLECVMSWENESQHGKHCMIWNVDVNSQKMAQSLQDIIGEKNAPEMRSTYLLLQTQRDYVVKPIDRIDITNLYAKSVVRLRRIDGRCRVEAAAFPELGCHKILLWAFRYGPWRVSVSWLKKWTLVESWMFELLIQEIYNGQFPWSNFN